MAALPENPHTTATAIVRWYESKPQEHRPHMGASLIGHACDRYIWSTWRWVLKPTFKGRILRLFDSGKREEPRLIEELRAIGATVWDTDPDTGDQWRVAACDGHFAGSLDGVAKGLPEAPKTAAVLEFKTHSNKSFNDLVKKRVASAKPQHYDQMTVYMGLMQLERALYMGVNKDTDDIYVEWVEFNRERFDALLARAKRLIEMTAPPYRLSTDPEHFECKWCTFHAHCHGGRAAEMNCRTCCHASPVADAAWQCGSHNEFLTLEEQREGCDDHLLIPGLVPYADAQDGGSTWVAYQHRESGKTFINGSPDMPHDTTYGPVFTSVELHMCPEALLSEVVEVKQSFPGARVVAGSPAPSRVSTVFDDMADDDPDAAPSKRDAPVVRQKKARVAATVKAMELAREGEP
jgi:hypothetical protein